MNISSSKLDRMEANYIATIIVFVAITLCTTATAETDCETHPEPVDPRTCCPIPDLISDEMKETCAEYMQPPLPPAESGRQTETEDEQSWSPRPHPHPHPLPHARLHTFHLKCLMSCVFNETGILDDERKLDEDALNEYLSSFLQDADEEWIPALEASFKTCIVKADEMAAKWQARKEEKMASSSHLEPHHRLHPGCPMQAGFLTGCVFMETFKNCPTSIWNDSENCNALRDHMQECKPKHGKWHHTPPNETSV